MSAERVFDPVPAYPLEDEFLAREAFRVLSWQFLEHPHMWHAALNLHLRLGCPVVQRWKRGGFATSHARRYGTRRGPPDPPRVRAEVYVPTDVPRWLRCNYCWGNDAYGISGPLFHPDIWDPGRRAVFEAWRDYGDRNRRARPKPMDNYDLTAYQWRQQAGGIYAPELVLL